MTETLIPLTLIRGPNMIRVTWAGITPPLSSSTTKAFFRGLELDRKDLSIKANKIWTDPQTVPASLKKFDGAQNYLL